jgi:hypothetical protein
MLDKQQETDFDERIRQLEQRIQGDGSIVLSGKQLVVDKTMHLSELLDSLDTESSSFTSHDHAPGGSVPPISHASLTGLDADDHPQYLKSASLVVSRVLLTFADHDFSTKTYTTMIVLIECDATGAFPVALPAYGVAKRYLYIFKKIDTSANAVTVQAATGETIR